MAYFYHHKVLTVMVEKTDSILEFILLWGWISWCWLLKMIKKTLICHKTSKIFVIFPRISIKKFYFGGQEEAYHPNPPSFLVIGYQHCKNFRFNVAPIFFCCNIRIRNWTLLCTLIPSAPLSDALIEEPHSKLPLVQEVSVGNQ